MRRGLGSTVSLAALAAAVAATAPTGAPPAGMAPAHAADAGPAQVAVRFVDPDGFTDAAETSRPSSADTARTLDELARFLREAGARILPEGRTLEVRVMDVDLAGEFEPWRGPGFERTRLVREAYPPRIALEFTLRAADGAVVAEGARTLRDPLYLTRAIRVTTDRLRYEKSLLEDWLRQELAR
jgi:hypothetical protein